MLALPGKGSQWLGAGCREPAARTHGRQVVSLCARKTNNKTLVAAVTPRALTSGLLERWGGVWQALELHSDMLAGQHVQEELCLPSFTRFICPTCSAVQLGAHWPENARSL